MSKDKILSDEEFINTCICEHYGKIYDEYDENCTAFLNSLIKTGKYRELEKFRDIEKMANDSNSYKKSILRAAQQRAKIRGLEFNIGLEDFEVPELCPPLNIPLHNHVGENTLQDDSPSLDRIDSSKGYIPGNVWVISNKANRAKNNLTLSELQQLVSNLENKCQSLNETKQ